MNIRHHFFVALSACLVAVSASAQSVSDSVGSQEKKAWELGLGGSLINWDRVSVSNFQSTQNNYFYQLNVKHLLGGFNLYAARELNRWFYLDLQGTVGFAGKESGSSDAGRTNLMLLAGPGLQFRLSPLFDSKYVDPYLRLGANVLHKNFHSTGMGIFYNDITGEASWISEDTWNERGYTNDKRTYFPLSLGAGMNVWLNNSLGIGLQGEYLLPVRKNFPRFAQFSLRLMWRIGGKDKRHSPSPVIRYVEVEKPVIVEKEVYVSPDSPRPVVAVSDSVSVSGDRVVERVVDRPSSSTVEVRVYDLLENVHFEFDKSVLTVYSKGILEEVARILKDRPGDRFLVTGFTDSLGSSSYNLNLSRRRAKAVVDELVRLGVPSSMLKWRGVGKGAAAMSPAEPNSVRLGDRKTTIERIVNAAYWDKLP